MEHLEFSIILAPKMCPDLIIIIIWINILQGYIHTQDWIHMWISDIGQKLCAHKIMWKHKN